MKKKIEILDCTLRDGGYYTSWDFDDKIVENYINRMNKLPIDIIEIGYRSNPEKNYNGSYFYLPKLIIDKIKRLNYNGRLAIMLNEKSVRLKDLDHLLNGLKPVISLVRLAVDPKNISRAAELASAIRMKGFDVAINIMYASDYVNDLKFFRKLILFNDVVEYLNIVDSYGGLLPAQLTQIIEIVKDTLNVKIGYHGHNNLELGFANTLAAIDAGCVIVDSTILGMGRGAGNLKTELLLTYLASIGKVNFDFDELSALVEAWLPLQKKYQWGTNLPYMVSGANSMPQKDVMIWVTQRFYSFNSIIRALNNKKLGSSDNLKLSTFKPKKTYKNVIIMGGGETAKIHSSAVKCFVDKYDEICIIHASAKNAKIYENFECEQFFCLVGNEGHRLEKVFNDLQDFKWLCILPSHPRKMGTYIPEIIRNLAYELSKITFTDKYLDSHTVLALQTSIELSAENIFLVGYDGYNKKSITQREQKLINENEYSFEQFSSISKLTSLLPTYYNISVKSIYSEITQL